MTSATIKLFLPLGTQRASGQPRFPIGQAGSVLRELDELLQREELDKSGIYILSGTDPLSAPLTHTSARPRSSASASNNTRRRNWISAIVFVSKDENLTEG